MRRSNEWLQNAWLAKGVGCVQYLTEDRALGWDSYVSRGRDGLTTLLDWRSAIRGDLRERFSDLMSRNSGGIAVSGVFGVWLAGRE